MKGQAKRKDFLNLLSKTNLVIPRRSSLPILESVLLVVGEDKLTITACNLDQCLIRSCKINADGEGKICVKLKPLERFLKSTEGEEATFVIDDNKLLAQIGDAHLTLEGLPVEEFPPIRQVEGKPIKISGLCDALKGIAYAMRADEVRPAFCGVCFVPLEKKVELVATDGFRLAATAIEVDEELPYQFILPFKTVQIILQLKLQEVIIKTGEKSLQRSYIAIAKDDEEILLISFLIQAEYPKYKSFLSVPKEALTLKIHAKDLRRGLIITSSLPSLSRFKTIDLRFEKELILFTGNRELGKVEVKIKAEGEIVPLKISENYLKDVLNEVEGEVALYTTGSNEPLFVSYQNFIHVLMPMRS